MTSPGGCSVLSDEVDLGAAIVWPVPVNADVRALLGGTWADGMPRRCQTLSTLQEPIGAHSSAGASGGKATVAVRSNCSPPGPPSVAGTRSHHCGIWSWTP